VRYLGSESHAQHTAQNDGRRQPRLALDRRIERRSIGVAIWAGSL
jgi:hypothetical protein